MNKNGAAGNNKAARRRVGRLRGSTVSRGAPEEDRRSAVRNQDRCDEENHESRKEVEAKQADQITRERLAGIGLPGITASDSINDGNGSYAPLCTVPAYFFVCRQSVL